MGNNAHFQRGYEQCITDVVDTAEKCGLITLSRDPATFLTSLVASIIGPVTMDVSDTAPEGEQTEGEQENDAVPPAPEDQTETEG